MRFIFFQRQDDAALDGHGAAAQPIAGAAGRDRQPLAVGQAEDVGHLLSGGDPHGHLRVGAQADGLVVGVWLQPFSAEQNIFSADDGGELLHDVVIHLAKHEPSQVMNLLPFYHRLR